ncbi:ISAs1 family transposase [Sphaerisporangium sp. NPDC051011]|uniref:ISAs1 family transposase n=1 Tax=Sphaerisporangium sp. NPDC051011 TaxID=3155792 RepID=UPI00340BA83D
MSLIGLHVRDCRPGSAGFAITGRPGAFRHSLSSILALAACGVAVAGGDSIAAVWHWAADGCPQEVLAELGVWRDPFTGRHVPPSERTFRRVLAELDGDALDHQVCVYLSEQGASSGAVPAQGAHHLGDDRAQESVVALPRERQARRVRQRERERPAVPGLLPAAGADGKTIRGARRDDGTRPHLLSLICQRRHRTLAQRAVDAKTSEVPALKALIGQMDATGMVITADALHTVRETARHLVEDAGAHYVLVLKGNQPAIAAPVMRHLLAGTDLDHERAGTGHTETDRGHSRTERRAIRTAPADGIDFPRAAQILRIVRHAGDLNGAAISKEVAYAITSLPPAWPDPPS